ncbi:hypothetical protein NQ317_011205 [Molorchus minor]|uniref:Uncharacterized protein n=1 Tax=Molorchus minor TaxID=1323400 RepID=A0ABQ9JRK7_9CUCU|nr:hypothetical protein NQ317_011205 [Molorchus minor]
MNVSKVSPKGTPSTSAKISNGSLTVAPQNELNTKLWDIGLYCSKAVQCDEKESSKKESKLEIKRKQHK